MIHLLPLLPSASLCLGCKISWVLRALQLLLVLGFRVSLPMLTLSEISSFVSNSTPYSGLGPVSPAWEISVKFLVFLPAPSCHSWGVSMAFLWERKHSSSYLINCTLKDKQLLLRKTILLPGWPDDYTVLCVSREQVNTPPAKCSGPSLGSSVAGSRIQLSNARSVV